MKTFFVILLAMLGSFVLAALIATWIFRSDVKTASSHLLSLSPTSDKIITADMLTDLPAPAQRYLKTAGLIGKPVSNTMRLKQTGKFRGGTDKPWMQVQAEQYFTIEPAGFIWDAGFTMFGIPAARAYDSHMDSKGGMVGRLFGLFPLMDAKGAELSQGTLLRYLTELVWMPTGYLGENITWAEHDDNSAIVSIRDGNQSVSAVLFFNAYGDVVNIEAQRYGEFGGKYEMHTWMIPVTAYAEFQGVRIPSEGQVTWKLPAGDFTYFNWKIVDLEYKVTEPY